MRSYAITSGLDSFIMIDRITANSENTIQAVKQCTNIRPWAAVESMAQCAAMFVRKQVDFKKHVFLMKTRDLNTGTGGLPDGEYGIDCTLTGNSEEVFSFKCGFVLQNELVISGLFIIGTMNYDNTFKQSHLENHYRRLYSCLINA